MRKLELKSLLSKLAIIISIVLFASCSTTNIISLDSGKQIDKRLIGNWKGCENEQQFQNVVKCWTMDRKDDGTFLLNFEAKFGLDIITTVESGKWWVENGKFYEFHSNSQQTDSYNFELLNKKEILFKSTEMSIDMNSDIYEFYDYRIGSKKEKQLIGIKDGKSIAKAIKVNSISEEYAYLRNNCKNCKLIQQALIFEKKKPYDLLEVEKPDGSRLSFYFDISSFFGK